MGKNGIPCGSQTTQIFSDTAGVGVGTGVGVGVGVDVTIVATKIFNGESSLLFAAIGVDKSLRKADAADALTLFQANKMIPAATTMPTKEMATRTLRCIRLDLARLGI